MIKIIKGSYGMRVRGVIVPITEKDGPISLDESKEARLVRLGVAVYTEGEAASAEDHETDEEIREPEGAEDQEHNEDNETDEADSDSVDEELPEYSEDMRLDELKAIAEKYGVDASKLRSKKDVIAAIEASKELPDLSAAELTE